MKLSYLRKGLFCSLLLIVFALSGSLQAQSNPNYRYLTYEGLDYILYLPDEEDLEPGETYPLVLYMHGSCGECVTHERIAIEGGFQFWHNYGANTQPIPTYIIAPASGTTSWSGEARREVVFEILDNFIEENPVDTERLYIMGFSMGGVGAWNYIQARPGFFAAINPQGINSFGVNAETVKTTPIWATIGADDTPSRVNGLRSDVAAIRAANNDPRGGLTWVTGVNPRLNIFPQTGHGGAQDATRALPGLKDWFYAQRADGNAPPNIRFVTPSYLDYYSEGEVTYEVSTYDADDTALDVEVFLDGDPIGTSLSGSVNLNTEGSYTLTATVTDPGGKSNTATVEFSIGTPNIELSPTSRESPISGDVYWLNVTADANWELSGLTDWISVDIDSGAGDERITVTIAENDRAGERTATLSIGGVEHVITQDGPDPETSLSSATHDSPAEGETYQITVTSNTSWMLDDGPEWVTVSPNFGEGDDTVSITVEANSETTARTGEVMLGGKTHTITQAGMTTSNAGWWDDIEPASNGAIDTSANGDVGIGWIYDSSFPWLFVYGLDPSGEWLYVMEEGGDRNGFFAYRWNAEAWLWASAEWGWYYQMGENAGWNAFNR